jgi:hypothetical protein
MKEPFYVYVAGPLSDMPTQYLANVHELCAASRMLMHFECCPINPTADLLEGLASGVAMALEIYQERSLNLLRLLDGKSACVYVTATHHADGRISAGVAAEIAQAVALRIPIVRTLEEVLELRRNRFLVRRDRKGEM